MWQHNKDLPFICFSQDTLLQVYYTYMLPNAIRAVWETTCLPGQKQIREPLIRRPALIIALRFSCFGPAFSTCSLFVLAATEDFDRAPWGWTFTKPATFQGIFWERFWSTLPVSWMIVYSVYDTVSSTTQASFTMNVQLDKQLEVGMFLEATLIAILPWRHPPHYLSCFVTDSLASKVGGTMHRLCSAL